MASSETIRSILPIVPAILSRFKYTTSIRQFAPERMQSNYQEDAGSKPENTHSYGRCPGRSLGEVNRVRCPTGNSAFATIVDLSNYIIRLSRISARKRQTTASHWTAVLTLHIALRSQAVSSYIVSILAFSWTPIRFEQIT